MAKLYFRYGAMGSSKTANILMVRYNYLEKGLKPLLLKPEVDTRYGEKLVRSRIGLEAECENFDSLKEMSDEEIKAYDAVLVDEAQFLKAEDVDFLTDIVDELAVPVLCYGLRTDFTGHLFEGSRRHFEVAEVIEEVPTVCWCGKRANFNARFDKEGNMLRTGEQVVMGDNDSYTSLCRKHYKMGKIRP